MDPIDDKQQQPMLTQPAEQQIPQPQQTAPSFQKSFHELTEALIEQNMPAINKAIDKIEREEEKPNKKTSFFVK
jgi:hypothetical protein